MLLNMFFPDSQNWIVFQPNIIIDAKLGRFKGQFVLCVSFYIDTTVSQVENCVLRLLC